MRRISWLSGIVAAVTAMWLVVRRATQRAQRGNDQYTDIQQAIREGRTDVARLEATQGTGGPGPVI